MNFRKEIRKIPINEREKQIIAIVEEEFDKFIKRLNEGCCECHMHPKQREFDKTWKCWFCVELSKITGEEDD